MYSIAIGLLYEEVLHTPHGARKEPAGVASPLDDLSMDDVREAAVGGDEAFGMKAMS